MGGKLAISCTKRDNLAAECFRWPCLKSGECSVLATYKRLCQWKEKFNAADWISRPYGSIFSIVSGQLTGKHVNECKIKPRLASFSCRKKIEGSHPGSVRVCTGGVWFTCFQSMEYTDPGPATQRLTWALVGNDRKRASREWDFSLSLVIRVKRKT
jgi:hypothetical protein